MKTEVVHPPTGAILRNPNGLTEKQIADFLAKEPEWFPAPASPPQSEVSDD